MPALPAPTAQASTWFELSKVLVPAVIGLVGVLVGGLLQLVSAHIVAGRQRKDRLEDEAAERARTAGELRAERNLVRALLARHLEAFARACAEAMWRNGDREVDGTTKLPPLPEWPGVTWQVLGASEMLKIRDFEVRVDIQHDSTKGAAWYGAAHEEEVRQYYADGAARVGLEAWRIAQRLREDAEVEPFRFPEDGANYAEALEEHVARLEERVRLTEERLAVRRTAGKEEFDPD